MSEVKELNLYQKISRVMQDIEYLAKDDKVSTGKTESYKAISEEKVTSSVRASLISNGLVILPIEQHTEEIFTEYEKEAYGKVEKKQRLLTRVDVKYKIVNINKPTEFEILASSGSGVDSQDKGVGKAMTYSYKYMLLRTFAIPTGEDPDKISSQELEEKSTVTQDKNKPTQQTKPIQQEPTQEQAEAIKAKVISKVQFESLQAELDRTGYKSTAICKHYKIAAIKDLTMEQWADAMKSLEKVKTKVQTDLGL